MTSDTSAYDHVWLRGATEPVVCGRLTDDRGQLFLASAAASSNDPAAGQSAPR